MQICISQKCKNKEKCKKHFINNEIEKRKDILRRRLYQKM